MANLPNLLSWLRVVLAPLVVLCFLLPGPGPLTALLLFLLAALSDYWDGRLARTRRQTSAFGAFLDPVADKILVCATLLLLAVDPQPEVPRLLLGLLAAAIILRELVQSAMRDWMAQAGRTSEVGVTGMSKSKTAAQLIGLSFLLGHDALAWLLPQLGLMLPLGWIPWVGAVALAVAAALGLASLAGFLRTAFSAPQA